MKKNINSIELRAKILADYNLYEKQFFENIPADKRNAIINGMFVRYTGYRLYHDGLKKYLGKKKDVFDNYTSFKDIKNYEQLAYDLNQTNAKSKDNLSRYKRKLHIARKERYKARKRKRVNEITKKEYKLKWEPKNIVTKERLVRLQKLKREQQNKEYER